MKSIIIEEDDRLRAHIRSLIDIASADFLPWQRVGNFKLIMEPFTVANGLLTQTLKVGKLVMFFMLAMYNKS